MAKTRNRKVVRDRVYTSLNFEVSGTYNQGRRNIKRRKKVSWRDEQTSIEAADPSKLADPAILIVKEGANLRYSRDELLKLREAPLSQRKPDFLKKSELPASIFETDRCNFERKKSDTPTENGPRGEGTDHRRRPGDPRERIRKENDGIVLSPQRRSFNSGCFVPVREPSRPNRSHSPLGKTENNHSTNTREIPTGNRRIGSGRILRDRDWDYPDKAETENDYSFRNRNNEREDKFNDRRPFGRDYEITRDKDKDNRRNRFNERRKASESSKDEEPEWFSGGPMSQNDTIELRGFDEPEKPGKKKLSPSKVKRAQDWANKKKESQSSTSEEKEESKSASSDETPPTPTKPNSADDERKPQIKNGEEGKGGGEPDKQKPSSIEDQFNFDEFLKSDIPGLTNGIGGDGDNAKSKFSAWFKRESPEKQELRESRRSSLHEEHLIKNLLTDITEPTVSIPGDSESYFTPISPAASTGGMPPPNMVNNQGAPSAKLLTIMEMIQKNKQQQTPLSADLPPTFKPPHMPGKILSLHEIEAAIRHNCDQHQKQNQQKRDEDLSAFNRLLAQMSGGHAIPANGPIPQNNTMTLLEMLSQHQHSTQQEEAHSRLAALLAAGPGSPPAPLHEVALKLQQVQQSQQAAAQHHRAAELVGKLLHPQLRASPLQDMGVQQSRELLMRPEAQAILQAMHQRIPSPRELQVHTQNILQRALIKKKLEEQQENYRRKQELARSGGGQSPQPPTVAAVKSQPSPTPLAFTPTSVLRKMTAEKEEGKMNGEVGKLGRPVMGVRPQQWAAAAAAGYQQPQPQQQVKQPVGRPIVKANNSTFQPEQFFTQQRLLAQQQQQAIQQQQQRKPSSQPPQQQQTPYLSSGPPNSHHHSPYPTNQQFSQQLTQQQLRAQHQQHARPPTTVAPASTVQQSHQNNFQQSQQQGNWQPFLSGQTSRANPSSSGASHQGGRGGMTEGHLSPTANQLARWFSPDLLERARAGELPSAAGLAQRVLSLEEIERQTAPPVHN